MWPLQYAQAKQPHTDCCCLCYFHLCRLVCSPDSNNMCIPYRIIECPGIFLGSRIYFMPTIILDILEHSLYFRLKVVAAFRYLKCSFVLLLLLEIALKMDCRATVKLRIHFNPRRSFLFQNLSSKKTSHHHLIQTVISFKCGRFRTANSFFSSFIYYIFTFRLQFSLTQCERIIKIIKEKEESTHTRSEKKSEMFYAASKRTMGLLWADIKQVMFACIAHQMLCFLSSI